MGGAGKARAHWAWGTGSSLGTVPCAAGSAVHYGLEPGRDALPERSDCCVGKGGQWHSYCCTWLEGVASVQGKTEGQSLKGDMTRARGLTSGGQGRRIPVVGGGAAPPYAWTEALDKQHTDFGGRCNPSVSEHAE